MKKQSRIKEFEARLKAVDSRVNWMLFVVLGLMLVISVIIDRIGLNYSIVSFSLIILLVAFLAFLIIMTVKGKAKVAEEFGVVCSVCGKVPKGFFMIQALKKKKCPFCGGDINA